MKLQFDRPHVRMQCEREANRYLLQIRQAFMRCHGRTAMLHALLHEVLGAMLPMFSAVLFLKGADRPRTRAGTINEIDRQTNFSVAPFIRILDDLTNESAIPNDDLESTVRSSYAALENLSEWIDAAS